MATYYVDGTNGENNTTDSRGTSGPDNAWLTLTYAEAQISENEESTIWIAPGTYCEQVEFSYGGTGESARFAVRGDPNCNLAWVSCIPGPVRITGASTATSGTGICTGNTLDTGSVDDIDFYDLHISGGLVGISAGSTGDDIRAYRCLSIDSDAGFRNAYCYNCVGIGGYCGYNGGYVYDSLGIGGLYGISNAEAHNSIFISAYPARTTKSCNCLMIGGYCGVYTATATGGSNIILGAFAGVDGGTYPQDCLAIACYKTCDADGFDLSSAGANWRMSHCRTDNSETNACADGHLLNFPDPMTMIRSMALAFKITGFQDYELAATNATTESFDIEGRARSMRDDGNTTANKIPPGPLTIPDVVIQGADEIRIRKMGEEIFYIPIEEDVDVTVTVTTAINGTGTMPTILLLEPDNDGGYNTGTPLDSDQAANNAVTSLAVTGSPSARDKICILKLKTEDTAVGAYTDFSNITIT